MTFAVLKMHKRMHIVQDGRSVYTPPDFLRVPGRSAFADLAEKFNERGERCIRAIMDFESQYSRPVRSGQYR